MLSTALMCLALNIYHEARGEPVRSQYLVAAVTMKRSNNQQRNVCDEVFKPRQFSWTNKLPQNKSLKQKMKIAFAEKLTEKDAWKRSVDIAKLALLGFIEQTSITHYHTKSVRPVWSRSKDFVLVAVIGEHRYYRQRT